MLLPFFTWCEQSVLGEMIRTSQWLFPFIEAFHLIGLAMIGGSILLVDLRLLGLVLRREPAAQLVRDAEPWVVGSLLVMALTGVLMFLSEAIKCYYSEAFGGKMAALALAIVFTFTVRRRVALAESRLSPLWSKTVAVISLSLWLAVGMAGRWIGFS
jgi:hypothetical protein